MAKITYETDLGSKIYIEMDEKMLEECDAMGIRAFQEVIDAVRKEVKAEKENK